MTVSDDKAFKKFITNLLIDRGNVKGKILSTLLTPQNMRRYRTAFTGASFDPFENYELLEFMGDGYISAYAAKFIRTKFYMVKNPDWSTKLKQLLTKNKQLGSMAAEGGFYPFVRISDEVRREIEKLPTSGPDILKNKKFVSVMEDIFESFIGTTITIFDDAYPEGIGFVIGRNITLSFYHKLDIPLDRDLLWDPITRLKELYENTKWPSAPSIIYRTFKDPKTDTTTVTVYGWPHLRGKSIIYTERGPDGAPRTVERPYQKNDYTRTNAIEITKATSKSEDEAKNTASLQALNFLLKQGFEEKIAHWSQRGKKKTF